MIDKKIMYERKGGLEFRKFENLTFCGTLLPSIAGYNSLNPRFLSLFNVLQLNFPSQENILKIYNSIILKYLQDFSPSVKDLATKLTITTIEFYRLVQLNLTRTPLKFHYIFNLRDISKIYEGLSIATKDLYDSPSNYL